MRAGIDTLIFVIGRYKRAIEDHFDSNPELEAALRAKGRHEEADMVRNILPEGVECARPSSLASGASWGTSRLRSSWRRLYRGRGRGRHGGPHLSI